MSEREHSETGGGVTPRARAVVETHARVVVTGFMAAGKTSVARSLAALLGCGAADTDELVRARDGRTPAEIIDADGEARFREIESRALRDALATDGPLVVATGGGTWTIAANRALIAERGCVAVWLDARFDLCWRRIEADAAKVGRPLARDRQAARALYHSRRADYRRARLRLRVRDGETAEEIAARAARRLKKLL